MAVRELKSGGDGTRKHRPYKKSRQGCRNCKLRKVKCDETKPQCRKCGSYGVLCNYDRNAPDLQVSIQSPHELYLRQSKEPKAQISFGTPDSSLCSPIVSADATVTFVLDRECTERFYRFRTRTLYTLGSTRMVQIFETEVLKMSYSNPYLMHVILAITALHDRCLRTPADGCQTLTETYHWSQCAALFHRKLSQPIQSQDRDPLWATAALLGTIALSSVEASTPEEAWPLRPFQPCGLEWIRMSGGKMAVWKLTDPLRPDSIFSAMGGEYAQLFAPAPHKGTDGIPSKLAHVCGLHTSSTAETNPYFTAAHALAQLQKIPNDQLTPPKSLIFVRHMSETFKSLLLEKDPVAILILALWYTTAPRSVWWIKHRARLEGQSICFYLQKYYKSNTAIQELLPTESDFPAL